MKRKITKVLISEKKKPTKCKSPECVWNDFQDNYGLHDRHIEAFKTYSKILKEWNETRNLTALKDLSGVVNQHFKDSLAIRDFVDFSKIKYIADVGSGAGFPGLPIKILFPHLKVILIEVSNKKQEFLSAIIRELGLKDVEICSSDWRTFLRKTSEDVDLLVTKAAVNEEELCRMFRTTSRYRDRQVAYWVSGSWECSPKVCQFVRRVETYHLGRKERKIVFIGLPESS